jgi:hypothetical protein
LEIYNTTESQDCPKKIKPDYTGFYWAAFLCLIFGGILFYGISYEPLVSNYQARQWAGVPCKVLSASIASRTTHSSGKTKISRRWKVLYQYTYHGILYQSERYCFLDIDPIFYIGLGQIRQSQKTGREMTCYVNPTEPRQAVLVRGFQPYLLSGILPLLFLGAGVRCFVLGFRSRYGTKPSDRKDRCKSSQEEKSVRTFTPQSSVQQAKIIVSITVFWNAAAWYGLYHVTKSGEWLTGNAWILIPVAAVGLLLLLISIHTLFGIGNPTPSITIEPAELKYGTSAMVSWKWSGNVRRVGKLKINLIGKQELFYKKGQKLHTEKKQFFEMPLVETEFSQEIVSGQAAFVMPDGDVPDTGDIVWSIRVYGRVKFWSDIGEEIVIMSQRKPTWTTGKES